MPPSKLRVFAMPIFNAVLGARGAAPAAFAGVGVAPGGDELDEDGLRDLLTQRSSCHWRAVAPARRRRAWVSVGRPATSQPVYRSLRRGGLGLPTRLSSVGLKKDFGGGEPRPSEGSCYFLLGVPPRRRAFCRQTLRLPLPLLQVLAWALTGLPSRWLEGSPRCQR